MFNLDQFINQYVIKRDRSMFAPDVEANGDTLRSKINGKSVLVMNPPELREKMLFTYNRIIEKYGDIKDE